MTYTTALVPLLLIGLACLTIEVNVQKRPGATSAVLESSTLSDPDARSDRASTSDDPCAADCSVFDAGYNWAEENAIANAEVCEREGKRSHAASFAEGCRQYIHAMTPED